MPGRVNIDGRIVAPEHATVSLFDRGFLYGDSVYEVLRTYGGRPFAFDEHHDRLARSAARLAMTLPLERAAWRTELDRTLAAAALPEAWIRIVVTRGCGEPGLDPALADRPTWIIMALPLHPPPPSVYEDGVAVAVVGVRRNLVAALDPAIKSGNYLNSVLAMAEARRAGAYEAVMLDHAGRVTECASSNIYLVAAGAIVTPPASIGILDGVTRHHVLRLARADGLRVREEVFDTAALRAADEAFLSSSIREVVPVTRIDGRPVGDGRAGVVTRRVMALFRACAAHATSPRRTGSQ